MRLIIQILASILALPVLAGSLAAAELVMVEQDGCHWCARWNEEIAPIYLTSDEGERAPLRRVDLHDLPENVSFTSRPVFTPTFVLVQDGQELGRLEGYPGEHFFWPMIGELLDAHPDATTPQM